ncbi:alpha/beta-type small acid-soluble spore protein [Proteinivorax tanatarense]|uniref:Alpha/beta-type small acid-soluble spore protein n=1 Tax=Proteinivorax tanatarense TaxID=1260629 RepID=A0AAU7VQ15_9FIRM
MARNSRRRRRSVVPGAEQMLDQYKYEVASELGLNQKIQSGGWNSMTTREVGQIGGQMVKRMIQEAEQQLNGGNGNR